MIHFRSGQKLETHAFAALLEDAHAKRPVHDHARLRQMLEASNVLLAAYLGDRLVGLLRGWTDGVCEGLICDLIVHPDVAKEDFAADLLAQLAEEHPTIQWWFPDASRAKVDLPRLGWRKQDDGWVLPWKR